MSKVDLVRHMTSWRASRWLLLYLAMLLADAAVVVAVVG